MAFDERLAWTDAYAEDRIERVRVNAAFWQGRPVLFTIGPEKETAPSGASGYVNRTAPILSAFALTFLAAAALMARRHLRQGRADRRGGAVLAGNALVAVMAAWVLAAGHVSSFGEIGLLFLALSEATFAAAGFWLSYVAIEPYVRRNWPDALISWTRLGRGEVRNGLVASHVLAGLVAGSIFERVVLPGARLVFSSPLSADGLNGVLAGTSRNLAEVWLVFVAGLVLAMLFLVIVVVLRLATRRLWLADVLGAFVFFGSLGLGILGNSRLQAIAGFLLLSLVVLVWMRLLRQFGFLTVLVIFGLTAVRDMPFTLTGWLAARSITLQLVPVALAGACLWVTLSSERRPTIEPAG
jgi:eukaryotic-like serine/threonine-protein kinase